MNVVLPAAETASQGASCGGGRNSVTCLVPARWTASSLLPGALVTSSRNGGALIVAGVVTAAGVRWPDPSTRFGTVTAAATTATTAAAAAMGARMLNLRWKRAAGAARYRTAGRM